MDIGDERGFFFIFFWEEDILDPLFFGENHRWEDGTHTAELPIEGQLSDENTVLDEFRQEVILATEYPNRDWEVETWSFLPDIRWSKIDGDTGRWEGKSRIFESTPHSLLTLLYRRVWESDDVEGGEPI